MATDTLRPGSRNIVPRGACRETGPSGVLFSSGRRGQGEAGLGGRGGEGRGRWLLSRSPLPPQAGPGQTDRPGGLEDRPEPPPSCLHLSGSESQGAAPQTREASLTAASGGVGLPAQEGQPLESHAFGTKQPLPLAESKGNEQPARLPAPAGSYPYQPPEEGDDADRAAQKEKLHEELKRVLQKKGESQRGAEETFAEEEEEEEEEPRTPTNEMETKFTTVEKTIKTSDLLEITVETEAESGVSGMSVVGGGKDGLYIKEVVKDSPAARVLNLKEGDQLLSARVYFDNIRYEDALQILKCAEPYKVSFWLKRTVSNADIALKSGTSAFKIRGPKAKIAKLNIRSLSPLKKRKKKKVAKILAKDQPEMELHGRGELAAGKLEIAPVDVEFSLPKFSKLRKAKSVGEVAMAEPSLEVSPRPASLEMKRRKLKFPRLKVKEAAAMAAVKAEAPKGRLEAGLPKVDMEVKALEKGEGKFSRFTIPFSKARKPKEAKGKVEVGFQAPQVQFDLSLPKIESSGESPQASAKDGGLRIQAPHLELPKVETVLPKVGTAEVRVPEGGLQAGLKIPVAEIKAPKVDIDLSFPTLEGPAVSEAGPQEEGFKFKVPKVGISPQEAELKFPSGKAPALEVILEKGRRKAEELEEKLKSGVAMPSLEVEVPSVEVELPLPKGRAEAELLKWQVGPPEVSVKIPSVSLAKEVSKAEGEAEGRLPQVELGFSKTESPKAKAHKIHFPGFGISLGDHKMEGKEVPSAAAESKVKLPGVKMPSLDISIPKVSEMELPKATAELAVPAGKAKSEGAAEASGFKFHMPQMSLPKFSLHSRAAPSPPQIHPKLPQSEGDLSVKVGIPKVDLSMPTMKLPDVQLPRGQAMPKPELDFSLEKPKVEVEVPTARLSFPCAGVPALDVDLPKVGVGLDLPKVEIEETPRAHESPMLKLPTLETMSQSLGLEISVPTYQMEPPEVQLSGRTFEAPDVSGVVARIPKVDLALGNDFPAVEGELGPDADLGLKAKLLPKVDLDLPSSAPSAKIKLPSVEIPTVTLQAVTPESSKYLEVESKQKSARFALPKFSISGPKVWKGGPEASGPELGGTEAADKGSKLKKSKFGISFPKYKAGAEVESPKVVLGVEGKALKGKLSSVAEPRVDLEAGMKLPTVDIGTPDVSVDISLPKGTAGEWSGEEGEVGVELPDLKLKVPKFSLPKFGVKSKEGEGELKTPEKEAKARLSKFKMPSFGMTRKDVEVSGLEPGVKIPKLHGSPKLKGPSVKMPKLALSSPKMEAGAGTLSISAPEIGMKVPQVELPKIMSSKEAKAEAELQVLRPESPSFKVKMPSVAIAGGDLLLQKPRVDISEVELRGYEGELKIPRVPSIGVSAPKVELDVSLPTARTEESAFYGGTSTDAKIKLPKVELPKFGKGEEGGVEAEVGLLGHRLSFGREGEKDMDGTGEMSLLGAKAWVPRVDLSLPKARLSDSELPLTQGEVAVEQSEGKFKMPFVGLPRFPAPKMKAPDVELNVNVEGGKLPKVKMSGPAIKLPRFGGSSSDGEWEEAEMDVPRVPQLELKAPKLRGSAEGLSPETGKKEAKIKIPSLPIGFGKADTETGLDAEEGKFKLKLPSLSLAKTGSESSTDTQPLCPTAQGPDFSFKMPDVGFSAEGQDGKREVKADAGKLGSSGELELDMGGFDAKVKMPKVKMPTFNMSGPKGDVEFVDSFQSQQDYGGGDLEGKKGAFKVPGLEISAPSLKAHAEYEVEGAELQVSGSQDLKVAGKWVRAGSDGRRSPVGKGEAVDASAGKKYKVKIPKFGLSLPKAGVEAGEVIPGQEVDPKAKRHIFALGRPKGKEVEGSSGLLEEEAEGKGMMAKLKLKPTFGLSISKPKLGADFNGESEEAFSKLKVPKVTFSKGEEASQLNGGRSEGGLQNGSQEGRGKMVGKIRLPHLELSSPSKTVPESDQELNLNLVKAEEAKEEVHSSISGGIVAMKTSRFKSPKITFSGFKKRNGEMAPRAVVSSAARTEMALLETGAPAAEGEKSSGFKFPKVVLSPKSHGVLEVSSRHPEDEGEFRIKLPAVGFSEEWDPEAGPGPGQAGAKPDSGSAAIV